jgi:hypothetical protein
MSNERQIPADESCPGLKAWTTCTYICFGEDLTESKINRSCIGNYTSCERYQEHLRNLTDTREVEFLRI